MGISRTCKDPKVATQFLNLLHTDKTVVNLCVFGIEGKHYKKVSDNVISLIDPKNSGYNPGNNWMFGCQFLDYLMENENPKKWDLFKEFAKKAIPDRLMGFVFDPEPVKTEIAACTNVYNQYAGPLASGAMDVDDMLPKYIADLKAAGGEKLMAEKQRQIDAFLAEQKKKKKKSLLYMIVVKKADTREVLAFFNLCTTV